MEGLLKKQDCGEVATLMTQAQNGSTLSRRKLTNQLSLKLRETIEGSSRKQKKDEILQQLYLDLIDPSQMKWSGRVYFLMQSSRCMRRWLVDQARTNAHHYDTATTNRISQIPSKDRLIHLDRALQKLDRLNEMLVKNVECRYFGNMTFPEIAFALKISIRQSKINWLKGRGWLYGEMNG